MVHFSHSVREHLAVSLTAIDTKQRGCPKQYDGDRRNNQLFEWGRGLAENKSWKYCEDDVEDDVNEDEDEDNDDEQVS